MKYLYEPEIQNYIKKIIYILENWKQKVSFWFLKSILCSKRTFRNGQKGFIYHIFTQSQMNKSLNECIHSKFNLCIYIRTLHYKHFIIFLCIIGRMEKLSYNNLTFLKIFITYGLIDDVKSSMNLTKMCY